MIKRLYVDNYKCLVNFELHLGELTLLLGSNGVGKSALLDVVFALRQLLRGVVSVAGPGIFPTRTLTRWQSRSQQVFELDVELEGELLTYRLEVEHEVTTRKAWVHHESLKSQGKALFEFVDGQVQLYDEGNHPRPKFRLEFNLASPMAGVGSTSHPKVGRFLDFLRKVLVCGLYPRSFVATSSSEDSLLERDGSNFAAWYRHVLQERPDLVSGYVVALQEVLEGFRFLRLEKEGQETRALLAVFEEEAGRYDLRLDELSEGQKALVALYGVLHMTAGQGYTLFLDEPDNYVALAEIQPWLMALWDACGETLPQAVLCSHHPELIDYLGSDCGLLLRREASGVVTARPLDTSGVVGGMKLSEHVARGWEQ